MKGRKMMKRGLATFLTGIMTVTLVAAGLTGCGSSTADKKVRKSQTDGMVSIRRSVKKTVANGFRQCVILLQKSIRNGILHLSME